MQAQASSLSPAMACPARVAHPCSRRPASSFCSISSLNRSCRLFSLHTAAVYHHLCFCFLCKPLHRRQNNRSSTLPLQWLAISGFNLPLQSPASGFIFPLLSPAIRGFIFPLQWPAISGFIPALRVTRNEKAASTVLHAYEMDGGFIFPLQSPVISGIIFPSSMPNH